METDINDDVPISAWKGVLENENKPKPGRVETDTIERSVGSENRSTEIHCTNHEEVIAKKGKSAVKDLVTDE